MPTRPTIAYPDVPEPGPPGGDSDAPDSGARALVDRVTREINAGITLEGVLDGIFDTFHVLLPYDRIGLALVDKTGTKVEARWARSTGATIELPVGYSADLVGSSLRHILGTGRPRIISDLKAYVDDHPSSESSKLILAEGIRSSLTCPLVVDNEPIGFLFFSSNQPQAYDESHVDLLLQIAGQLSVIVGKGELVSQIEEQRRELEKRNEELEALNTTKDRLMGMAAHDIRSPVSVILMFTEYLRELVDGEAAEMVDTIESQAQHVIALVDDLLDVSQIESGQLDLDLQEIDFAALVAAGVARHDLLGTQKDSTVVLEERTEGKVRADPIRLMQVIDNLLSNAVKYSPPGSTIRVRARRESGGWKLEVEDEGPGLSAEDQKRLFTYFGRVTPRPTASERSTGLGLAISKRVVEAHGGEIGVDSEEGRHSIFWFTLPD